MTTTLYLAWQDVFNTRKWFTIGRLEADDKRKNYIFKYTEGAIKASAEAGMTPLIAFPDFKKEYKSEELFPLFKNRVISSKTRRDLDDYLTSLDLDNLNSDPLEILAISEGKRTTDNLEVFPKIELDENRNFKCRFFLHGWRHLSKYSHEKLDSLDEESQLQVEIEMNNPVTGLAIQFFTQNDYVAIGWAPRYMVIDIVKVIQESYKELKAKLIKKNNNNFPAKERYLIELSGTFPENIEPMSSEDFRVL